MVLCPSCAHAQYIAVLLSIATPHEGVIAQIIAVTFMMLALSTDTLLLIQSEVSCRLMSPRTLGLNVNQPVYAPAVHLRSRRVQKYQAV